jgi:hypothetical protein
MFLRFLLLATTFGAFTVAGCSANGTGTGPGASAVTAAAVPNTSLGQILIAFDSNSGRLEYWNFGTGGSKAQWLSRTLHISDAMGMVANGDTVYIASDSPPAIVSYDVDTKKTTTLGDPYGAPLDVAIDRNADVYALNAGNVTVFPPRAQPYELSCPFISASTAIAVDNEANVFVGGSGPGSFAGIVEYATGSSTCAKLPIKTKASVTGLGVNPRTDALIVVDNVNCTGGSEGRVTAYHRPIGSKRIVHRGNLHANCPGPIRLDATARYLLFPDGPLQPNVSQRNYPGINYPYVYLGGTPSAFTTIPNTLPN